MKMIGAIFTMIFNDLGILIGRGYEVNEDLQGEILFGECMRGCCCTVDTQILISLGCNTGLYQRNFV